MCELACDVSTLNLILKCIEYLLLGNALSPWQHVNNFQQNVKNDINCSGIVDDYANRSSTSRPY